MEYPLIYKIRLSAIILLLLLFLSGCILNEKNQAKGTLERDRITLSATSNEIIQSLPIIEGSSVKKGDVLVQFETQRQQAMLAKAVAQQAQAQANLEKMLNGERIEDIEAAKANLDSAKAQLTDTQKTYDRMLELVAQKYVSQASADNALAQKDAAQAAFDAAEQNWKKLSQGSRQEDIDATKAALEAADAEVAYQQQIFNNLTVKATRDGILDSLPFNEGERVAVGSTVAIIQADTKPYGRVYVPEPYLATLTKGKPVIVHIDGVADAIAGTVRWVSVEPAFTPYTNMSEADRSRFVYLVEINLSDDALSLAAGIPIQMDLE